MSAPAPEPSPPRTAAIRRPQGPSWTRSALWFLLGICVLAAVLRLYHIEQWSWSVAEAGTWRLVTAPVTGDGGFFASGESRFPVVYLGLRWLLSLGILPTENELWLRLPFAFVGAISVPLLALLVAQINTVRVALGSALLLALHPWHVAASQSAEPAVVATFAALVVGGLMLQRRRVAAVLAQVLAGLCHPLGWLVMPAVLFAQRLPPALAARLPVLLWLSVAAWVPHFEQLRPTVLLLAAVALAQPNGLSTPACWAAALPLAVVAPLALLGMPPAIVAGGLLGLPPLLVLAAHGAALAARSWRDAARAPLLQLLLSVLALVLAVADLSVTTFLQATLYAGQRPAWREARALALQAAGTGRGLCVGAGLGAEPLTAYLRPNHWREPGDPHPGLQVLRVGTDAAALRAFVSAAGDAAAVLVWRADEEQAVQSEPAAAALLQQEFTLWQVLPGPRDSRDDTLFVHRRRLLR